jgi:hypothetical protein
MRRSAEPKTKNSLSSWRKWRLALLSWQGGRLGGRNNGAQTEAALAPMLRLGRMTDKVCLRFPQPQAASPQRLDVTFRLSNGRERHQKERPSLGRFFLGCRCRFPPFARGWLGSPIGLGCGERRGPIPVFVALDRPNRPPVARIAPRVPATERGRAAAFPSSRFLGSARLAHGSGRPGRVPTEPAG